MCRYHVSRLLLHIKNFGLHINEKKSKLEPSQVIQFLGMTLGSCTASISLTTQWNEAIRACLHHFRIKGELEAVSPSDGTDGSHCSDSSTHLLHMQPVQ